MGYSYIVNKDGSLTDTMDCPFCGSKIPKDSEVCPYCYEDPTSRICRKCGGVFPYLWDDTYNLCQECYLAMFPPCDEDEYSESDDEEQPQYHEFLAGGEICGFKIYE